MRQAANLIVIVPFFVIPILLLFLSVRVARSLPRMQNLVRASFVVWLLAEGAHRITEAMGWVIAEVEYAAALASLGVMFETVRYVRWLPKIVAQAAQAQEGDDENGRGR